MYGLVHTAIVYLPNDTDGTYTVVDNSALPCRLTLVSPDDGKDTHDRAELAAMRRLLWDNGYTLPEKARVEINSEDWAVVGGSFAVVTALAGVEVYRRAELVRAL